MNKKDSLGDRMKRYEDVWRQYLPRRMPLIVRVDGKGFHSFTKDCQKPFDSELSSAMQKTAQALLKGIDGAKFIYQQSDEISVLVIDYDTLNREAWFDNNLQKIVSVSSSLATSAFNDKYLTGMIPVSHIRHKVSANFDCRAFVIPREDVTNYFLWRQQDAIRNAIQMFARAYMSHKECQGKSCKDLLETFKLWDEKNIAGVGIYPSWKGIDNVYKLGFFYKKNEVLNSFLIKDNRNIIEELVNVGS